jgi:hypothetical protein
MICVISLENQGRSVHIVMTLSPAVWGKLGLFPWLYMKSYFSPHYPDVLGVQSGLYGVISALFSGLKWTYLELFASSSVDFSKKEGI